MTPPFLSYITFNRLGLTQKNLKSVLDTPEDFEMHIIDSNSSDNTWEYLESLTDPRIKSKTRFPVNAGPIYALNFNLVRRRPDQYFITVDNDVYMKTQNWISRFMEVFNTFPEAGLLGVQRGRPYPEYLPPVIPKIKNGISYHQLMNGQVDVILDFIPGCCQCIRPELIKETGYWSEENGYGDAELSPRVNNYTSFKAGFIDKINIDMTQSIECSECSYRDKCTLNRNEETCFSTRNKVYKNESFAKKYKYRYLDTFKEMQEGKRTAYCASIFDPESQKGHLYHQDWALENFNYYIQNAN